MIAFYLYLELLQEAKLDSKYITDKLCLFILDGFMILLVFLFYPNDMKCIM